ncbi:MAG: ComEC/Rec2 family competence protein [Sedimentisphaerales bacterium]|nr:ComEC/Rec2 family competence protein [Sedimentisphaerales bacterium]
MAEGSTTGQDRTNSGLNSLVVVLAAAVIVGIITADALMALAKDARVMLVTGGVIILVGLALTWRRRSTRRLIHWQFILLTVVFFVLGAGRLWLDVGCVRVDHIVRCASEEPTPVTLEGRIITEPRLIRPEGDFARHDFLHQPGTWFRLQCCAGRGPEGDVPLSGQVSVFVRQPAMHLHSGRRIRLEGEISLRQRADNPGTFTNKRRQADSMVVCTVPVSEAIEVLSEKADNGWAKAWRSTVRQRLLLALGEEDSLTPASVQSDRQAFLAALLLGERSGLSPVLQEQFIRAGTLHFLAISGLHVGLVTAFAWGIGWLLRWDRRWQAFLALAATIVYVLLVPARPPVLRAGIMAGVFCIAYLARRRSHPLNLLSIAVLIILLVQPTELFNPGFQLSFVVVLGLICLVGPMMNWRGREEDLPIFERRQTAGQWVLHGLGRWAGGLLAVALVAWIVALPLTAWHFHRVSFAGIFASIALAPLIALVMLFGWMGVGIGWLWPTVGLGLNTVTNTLVDATLAVNSFFARINGLHLNTASPPLLFIIIYYLLLVVCVIACQRRRGRKWAIAALAVVLGLFLLLLPFRQVNDEPVMHVLSVGDGCATVLETKSTTLLYDAGSLSRSQVGAEIIVPFLRQRGTNRIDAIFISHDNLDHFNGVLDVCRLLPVGKVYVSPLFLEHAEAGSFRCAERVLLDGLASLGVSVETLAAGDSVDWPKADLAMDILWPPAKPLVALDDNNGSLVAKVTTKNGSLLLCGDAEDVARRALLAQNPERLRSDVLLLPHHGSVHHYESLAAFVTAVDPAVALNSTGPNPESQEMALVRLLQGRYFYSTDHHGQISVELMSEGAFCKTFKIREH